MDVSIKRENLFQKPIKNIGSQNLKKIFREIKKLLKN